jgi:SAM-dependent methyltransferase
MPTFAHGFDEGRLDQRRQVGIQGASTPCIITALRDPMSVRLMFPACARNRDPILAVLRDALVDSTSVLEVACGSGEHAAYFAPSLPWLEWLPTDLAPEHVASARSWSEGIGNVRPAVRFDVVSDPWPAAVDAVFSANMVHIAPWPVAEALFRRSAENLPARGLLVTYGPYRFGGQTAPSNEVFDASLRERNAAWGVRDVDDLARLGMTLERKIAMPANNHVLIFRRP